MEEETGYTVEITPEAELYYINVLEYFYSHHSVESADRKSGELLEQAMSLENYPSRGSKEELLKSLGKDHRYLLYHYTRRKTIKIIYFIDHHARKVYVTDFFPCAADEKRIIKRTR